MVVVVVVADLDSCLHPPLILVSAPPLNLEGTLRCTTISEESFSPCASDICRGSSLKGAQSCGSFVVAQIFLSRAVIVASPSLSSVLVGSICSTTTFAKMQM